MKCMKLPQKKREKRTQKSMSVEGDGNETIQKILSPPRQEIVIGYSLDRTPLAITSRPVSYAYYFFHTVNYKSYE